MFYAPASLTCFFSPKIPDGSMGVGLTLSGGAKVSVERSNELEIYVNGERRDFNTVKTVAECLGFKGRIEIQTDLPIGCGFGMSGASALASAVAIDPSRPLLELADIAHRAEVTNRTGLGDVVTQCHGGVVLRLVPAPPSKCKVKRFLWKFELDVLVIGSLDTEKVLSEFPMDEIAKIGRDCTKEFIRNPKLDNLFEQSKRFAIETGLIDIDQRISDAIEAVEANGGRASMIMLGRGVFAIGGDVLKEFKGIYFKVGIDHCGVRSLD